MDVLLKRRLPGRQNDRFLSLSSSSSSSSSSSNIVRFALMAATATVVFFQIATSSGNNAITLDPTVNLGISPLSSLQQQHQQHSPPSPFHFSPMLLWTRHSQQILRASQHVTYDPNYQLYNITRDIFHTITPRLDLSIRAVPLYNHRQVQTIHQKLQARRQYLRNKMNDATKTTNNNNNNNSNASVPPPPPPLRILVMGGSVAKGVMCNTGLPNYIDDKCSWPERLKLLLNFDFDTGKRYDSNEPLVQIDDVAVGGWNTAVSNLVLQYDLLQEYQRYPDIIINAHSTNEMHVNTIQQAVARNQTHWQAAFDMTQDFIRTVSKRCLLSSKSGSSSTDHGYELPLNEPPLLIYFDDYLGNDQRSILDTTTATQGAHVLAKYYGIGYVSFADVVRDIVYRQTNETVFSPNGWYNNNKDVVPSGGNGAMLREVHPGYGMHIASSFVLAYYFLQLQTSFSAMEEYYPKYQINNQQFTKLSSQPTPDDTSLLPPKLDRSLLLDNVSERYYDNTIAERRSCTGQRPSYPRCPVSWLIEASPGSYSVDATMDYFRPYLAKDLPQEWEWFNAGVRQRPKFGFTPVPVVDKKLSAQPLGPGTNRTMTLEFHPDDDDNNNNQLPIATVTVFYLQRNETKWKGSEMTVSVYGLDHLNSTKERKKMMILAQQAVTNYHPSLLRDNKVKTTIELVPPQSHVQVEFKHTGGASFRMTGLAVCH
ncbi:hypothetical protein IV203_033218 [Nitzschia inconspicua]|uniref:Uncharacterized protein n=1 Tax=Nitzschia inconspicua TaxID=303405 RepID=A0A9K3PFI8_9STRA|nr:hypothetical protein IV203_033218 [Nitzschia inconspicua]